MNPEKLTLRKILDFKFIIIKCYQHFLFIARILHKFFVKRVPSRSIKGAAKVDVSYFTEIPKSDISEHLSFYTFTFAVQSH